MTHRDFSVQHWGGTIAYLIWMFLSHKTVRCLVLKHKRKMLIRYKIRLKLICKHKNLVLFTIPQENSFRMTQNGNKPALVRIMTWRRKYDMPLSELIKANIFFLPTDICVMRPRCSGHVTEYMLRMEMYCDQPIDRFSACGADSRGSIKGGTMAYSICTFEGIVW